MGGAQGDTHWSDLLQCTPINSNARGYGMWVGCVARFGIAERDEGGNGIRRLCAYAEPLAGPLVVPEGVPGVGG